jgi:hypothetical protein
VPDLLSAEEKNLDSDWKVRYCAVTVPVQTTPRSKTHSKFVTLGRCHVRYIRELQQILFLFLELVLKLTTSANIMFTSLA